MQPGGEAFARRVGMMGAVSRALKRGDLAEGFERLVLLCEGDLRAAMESFNAFAGPAALGRLIGIYERNEPDAERLRQMLA